MTALTGSAPDTDDTRGVAKIAFDDACRLVYRVGLAAHGYGSSAVQVETYLSRLLSVLGYRGVIRTGPTELLFAIDDEGGRWQRLYLAEREGGSLDFDKLARLGELVDDLVAGRIRDAVNRNARREDPRYDAPPSCPDPTRRAEAATTANHVPDSRERGR